MAYTLKSVRYMDKPRHILLQNSNGPCPLLAAANALLLQGTLSLPPQAIRSNVASISDVVNMLAERALKGQGGGTIGSSSEGKRDESSSSSSSLISLQDDNRQYHIHEVMTLFPSLQYGMDVNPKFQMGPTGYEYTMGLSVFDLMGVELVHGWLVDEQDIEVASIIGSRSYNELVEMMIRGNEAKEEMEKLVLQMDQLKKDNGERGEEEKEQEIIMKEENAQESSVVEQELMILQSKLDEMTEVYHHGQVIGHFLSNTSTQLTYTGLMELHNHVKEGSMCVFFRNNHFATMTKHSGILYLLVTDLGYANVPEVMWEKLDDINGDTEYADEKFARTQPRNDISAALGPTLTPEQMLAQSSVAEADYQLALQLSRNERAIDEQEGKMIAAATEASLHVYNMEQHGIAGGGTTVNDTATADMDEEYQADVARAAMAAAREEEDRMVAMQLQAQFEEDAARENRLAGQQTGRDQNRPQAQNQQGMMNRRQKKEKGGGCIIS
mmetsp:Transcript_13065/g.24544  ORF Transcript_13065/g.24544 Transcript_13065/m.24544 type:complete len:497 (+) Transcript_13065:197-1687(+)